MLIRVAESNDIETLFNTITSLTPALPLLLVFTARPLALISRSWAQWIQDYYRELWLVLTASHCSYPSYASNNSSIPDSTG